MNNYYKLYIDSIYQLAETIAIKFEDIALEMNNGVIKDYGITAVDAYDKSSWKYYQNMSGRYHFSDTEMTVTSLDTLESIVFNQTNLINHPNTRRAYEYNTRYYWDLVNRYPTQELLIKGILYAPNSDDYINAVIEAKDGTILYYPSNLIEENEYNLISNLQTWIYNYADRWINFQFRLSDDLYVASYLGQLYIHLVPAIFNLRLANCKTNEVHSYHVREYLSCHGMLDKYLDVMTKEQALFFYRNILYIQRNAGKRDTFDWLIENLMTKRSLPVFEYSMKHKVNDMLPTDYAPNQLNYNPETYFKRRSINYQDQDTVEFFYNFKQVVDKIKNSAPQNEDYHAYHYQEIEERLEDSISNVVYTKLLESVVDDYTNAVPYTLESILLNHWIYWSATNKYKAKISLILPKTKKPVSMSAKDALILYYYALTYSLGYPLEKIPTVIASRVLRENKATLAELKSITEREFISDEDLTALLATVPEISDTLTVNGFYDEAYKVYDATKQQYFMQARSEWDHHCAQLQLATTRLYQEVKLNLAESETLYSDWFNRFSLDFSDYSSLDFNDLAYSIFYQTTDILNKKGISIKRVQKAMIEIFTILSSYSIQFISDVNESPIELVTGKEVKLLKILTKEAGYETVELNNFDALEIDSKEKSLENYRFNENEVLGCVSKEFDELSIELGLNLMKDYDTIVIDETLVPMPLFGTVGGTSLAQDLSLLTNEQKQTLVSIY